MSGGGGVDGAGEAMAQFLSWSAAPTAGAFEVDAGVGGADCLEAPHEHPVAVTADLLAESFALFHGGRLGDRGHTRSAESVLDAVLTQERGEFGTEQPAVLAVHHGVSLERATSSMSRTSSTWSASSPWSMRSSMAVSATV